MNVFDCAIKIEEEAKKYYERREAEITPPEMKRLFSLLAASEEVFRENLIRLKGSLPPEQAQLDGLDCTACSFERFLTARKLLEGAKDDPAPFSFSMREEEQKIARFYEELAKWASDLTTHRCLLMLAEEERRHLNLVEHICDFAEAPRGEAFA